MKRHKIEVPVESQIVKKDRKTSLTGVINAVTKDLSLGGVKLKWPKGWKCENCNRCLGWIFNEECRFKANMEPKINRDLNLDVVLKLRFLADFIKEKDYFASVVWIQTSKVNQSTYDTGLSFSDSDSNIKRLYNLKQFFTPKGQKLTLDRDSK